MSNLQHEQAARFNRAQFGFWLYLMTDCILFASLFATYAVMRQQVSTGPSGAELFDLPFVLVETVLLLTSSFLCGLAMIALHNRNRRQLIGFLLLTGALGAAFVGMELYEFSGLVREGAGWQTSGFLSAYFALVATHGLHIVIGLIWLLTMVSQLLRKGISVHVSRRLHMFSMFWHFLDVIWIFIFSIVYLWSGRL